ncbi:RNA recognition motif domain-containing protein [Phycisphaera mikurensis]|uniref:RNA-binding protein n=1 Tax=Phycisphaera mikurensis (strain NBRC 102666 / KCTC 22515 / FYK2301M01) TaxID=1142394 RepID=I0IAB2_PHYMF|nr:RNA-binding protein [Phycisphaera mikurensis]MBB6441800.1 RNA recognition motif-containing protein [Phycisphaera mikurensis]BAM02200.1 RNA-binding protein [Phycisphaera mikurensis NBRC 102666]
MINIYIGNLPYKTGEADLADLFSRFGTVERATIVKDRDTGRSRGFGFVEMEDHAAGTLAIETLLAEEYNGRPLTINEARPRGGGGGGTGGGGGGSPSRSPSPPASAPPRAPRTSFGNSIGYSNQLAEGRAAAESGRAEPDPAAEPEDASVPEPPVSRGYTNDFLPG